MGESHYYYRNHCPIAKPTTAAAVTVVSENRRCCSPAPNAVDFWLVPP